MGDGLESVIEQHHPHRTHDLRSVCQDHNPFTNSMQKTICCNLTSNATKKMKVFGFVGTDHLRTKIIINDETLEQVSQFTYLGCSISYQFSNDVEFKLAKFLLLIGTIKEIFLGK